MLSQEFPVGTRSSRNGPSAGVWTYTPRRTADRIIDSRSSAIPRAAPAPHATARGSAGRGDRLQLQYAQRPMRATMISERVVRGHRGNSRSAVRQRPGLREACAAPRMSEVAAPASDSVHRAPHRRTASSTPMTRPARAAPDGSAGADRGPIGRIAEYDQIRRGGHQRRIEGCTGASRTTRIPRYRRAQRHLGFGERTDGSPRPGRAGAGQHREPLGRTASRQHPPRVCGLPSRHRRARREIIGGARDTARVRPGARPAGYSRNQSGGALPRTFTAKSSRAGRARRHHRGDRRFA